MSCMPGQGQHSYWESNLKFITLTYDIITHVKSRSNNDSNHPGFDFAVISSEHGSLGSLHFSLPTSPQGNE
eukprot:642601-Pelagomonas_calceolata.AAC.4